MFDIEKSVERADHEAWMANPKSFEAMQNKMKEMYIGKIQKSLVTFGTSKVNDLAINRIKEDVSPSVERLDYAFEITTTR